MLRNWGCCDSACRLISCQRAPAASVYECPARPGRRLRGLRCGEGLDAAQADQPVDQQGAVDFEHLVERNKARLGARRIGSARARQPSPRRKLESSTTPYRPPRRLATPRNHGSRVRHGLRRRPGKDLAGLRQRKQVLRLARFHGEPRSRTRPRCAPPAGGWQAGTGIREGLRGWPCAERSRLQSGERTDLGHQLGGIDRLDDVVAGALAHAPDAVGFLVLAGAHDDRHRSAYCGLRAIARVSWKPFWPGITTSIRIRSGCSSSSRRDGVFGVFGRLHREAVLLQQVGQETSAPSWNRRRRALCE